MPSLAFGKNSFEISEHAIAQLNIIKQQLTADPSAELHIYALASADENGQRILSLKRSDAILRFLLQAGIPVERIKSFYFGSNISLSACTRPNCPEESLAANRCVAYQIVKK